MTPLTVDCARCRQLLPALHDDDAASAEDRAFVEAHARECAGCAAARSDLEAALTALRGLDLPPDELARLLPTSGELDTRPLLGLVVACLVAVTALVVGVAAVSARGRWAAPPPLPAPALAPAPVAWAPPAPTVGGEVGLEVDEALEEAATSPAEPPPPEAEAPPAEEVALAAAPAAPARAPAPPARAPAPGVVVAPRPAPAPPPPAPVAPPAGVLALVGRLEVSTALTYRGVTFHLLRDPDGRDRLARPRTRALPAQAREVSPPDPTRCAVRPPGVATSYRLLPGELLDAPCGLRVATAAARIAGRTELAVEPAGYDAASAVDGRPRRDPLLKGPVLLPSRARAALAAGDPPGAAIGAFMTSLADPTVLELRRLREELDRLEPEALDLERRLHANVEDTRGLRGLAVSIPRPGAGVGPSLRAVDLVGSARELADVLPRLVRAALLEAALEQPREREVSFGPDPRPANLVPGRPDDPGREEVRAAVRRLLDARRPAAAAADAPYAAATATSAALLALGRGDALLHATVLAR